MHARLLVIVITVVPLAGDASDPPRAVGFQWGQYNGAKLRPMEGLTLATMLTTRHSWSELSSRPLTARKLWTPGCLILNRRSCIIKRYRSAADVQVSRRGAYLAASGTPPHDVQADGLYEEDISSPLAPMPYARDSDCNASWTTPEMREKSRTHSTSSTHPNLNAYL